VSIAVAGLIRSWPALAEPHTECMVSIDAGVRVQQREGYDSTVALSTFLAPVDLIEFAYTVGQSLHKWPWTRLER
jgi:hypothetical protein